MKEIRVSDDADKILNELEKHFDKLCPMPEMPTFDSLLSVEDGKSLLDGLSNSMMTLRQKFGSTLLNLRIIISAVERDKDGK